MGYQAKWKTVAAALLVVAATAADAADTTALPSATAHAWSTRLRVELQDKRYAAAVATLTAMAARDPKALNAMPILWYNRLLWALQDDKTLRRKALAVLGAPSFEPNEIGASPDSFRKEYAGLLVDSGDKMKAAALIALIREPDVLIDVSLDSCLRRLVPANFDARAVTEQALAQAQEVAANNPRSLHALIDVSIHLDHLSRVGRLDRPHNRRRVRDHSHGCS